MHGNLGDQDTDFIGAAGSDAPLPTLDNRVARRVVLERQGLAAPPYRRQSKSALQAVIEQLGFVQIDSINTVERAHHMILFARNQTYNRKNLAHLLERDRALFENWTHDASIIPTCYYPYWRRHFERHEPVLRKRW
ncbi:MAG: DNA glycosylase AlkZ-like family protein, partial [Hyphomicrobiaceae bacterium]